MDVFRILEAVLCFFLFASFCACQKRESPSKAPSTIERIESAASTENALDTESTSDNVQIKSDETLLPGPRESDSPTSEFSSDSNSNSDTNSDTDTATDTDSAPPSNQISGEMLEARTMDHTIKLLDGRVLALGGTDLHGYPLKSAEIYNPKTESFEATGSLNSFWQGEVATLLKDGRVLVIGGKDENGFSVSQAELYDPVSGEFKQTDSPTSHRAGGQTATPLSNGNVLVTGGRGPGCSWNSWVLHTAEIYDAETEKFSKIRTMRRPRVHHSAVEMKDGRVLISGGHYCYFSGIFGWITYSQANAEIYDPETGNFTEISGLNYPRARHFSIPLPDGRVFILGGEQGNNAVHPFEIFDPQTETFSLVKGGQSFGIYRATHLKDSKIFFLGEVGAQIFDYETGELSRIEEVLEERYSAGLAVLDDQSLLIAGRGRTNPKAVERIFLENELKFESVMTLNEK